MSGIVNRYFADLRKATRLANIAEISAAFDVIIKCLTAGNAVYLAGNGGSASTASHLASDWLEASLIALDSARVYCLTDNVSTLTRIANDFSYEQIFSRQLTSLGATGDTLVLLSVGGQSKNLINAAQKARMQGMTIVSMLGINADLARFSDHAITVGDGDYGVSEDLHLSFGHAFVRCLREGLPHVCADIR